MLLDDSIIFDLGPGGLKNLVESNTDTNRLSKVFISHTHADHITDLVAFLWTIQIGGRTSDLDVYGPPGFKRTFAMLLQCTSTPENFFKFPLRVHELDFGEGVDNISTGRASHSIPTIAFRVESSGSSFCYSADTAYCPDVVGLASDADLLLHEATFLNSQAEIADLTRHSTARSAGLTARNAKAKKLVLFHIPPPNDHAEEQLRNEASVAYGREATIAYDMMSLEF